MDAEELLTNEIRPEEEFRGLEAGGSDLEIGAVGKRVRSNRIYRLNLS